MCAKGTEPRAEFSPDTARRPSLSEHVILRQRVLERAKDYYPEESADGVTARVSVAPYRSTNPIFVVELRFPSSGRTRTLVGKVTPSQESAQGGRREFETLRRLHGSPVLALAGVSVPRPIDYFDDLRIGLTEFVPGEKLGRILRKSCSLFASRASRQRLVGLLAKSGACLRAIHDISKTGAIAPVPDALSGKIRETHALLLQRGALSPTDPPGLLEATAGALALLGGGAWPIVRQHGDYCPGNILVQDGTFTVIDFTFSSENLVFNDLGRFLAALDIINPYPANLLFDFRALPRLGVAFLEGYFGTAREISSAEWILIELFRIRNILVHFRSRGPALAARGGRIALAVAGVVYRRSLRAALADLRRRCEARSPPAQPLPEGPEIREAHHQNLPPGGAAQVDKRDEEPGG